MKALGCVAGTVTLALAASAVAPVLAKDGDPCGRHSNRCDEDALVICDDDDKCIVITSDHDSWDEYDWSRRATFVKNYDPTRTACLYDDTNSHGRLLALPPGTEHLTDATWVSNRWTFDTSCDGVSPDPIDGD
jgi:hypothetical protein